MRFNSRACALMEIPDLPSMAFQHIGDKKIKPQGGGNPIAAITDPISSALGTDGGGGGILGGLADIDPGPALGSGLAEVDTFVNREIPGGWVTVGLAAATAGAGAAAGAGAGAAAGSTAGAAGGTAAGTGLSAAELLAVGGFAPTAGSAASFTVPSAIAAGAGAGGSIGGIELGGAFLPTAGSGASFAVPGAAGTGSSLPIFDYSQEVILSPGGNYIPATTLPSEIAGLDAEILKAGEAAIKAAPSTVSPFQAVNALRGASGLLGGQQGTPAGAPAQFRGSSMPQGAVDYSGILNLLQARMPQRNPNSLLG